MKISVVLYISLLQTKQLKARTMYIQPVLTTKIKDFKDFMGAVSVTG